MKLFGSIGIAPRDLRPHMRLDSISQRSYFAMPLALSDLKTLLSTLPIIVRRASKQFVFKKYLTTQRLEN